MKTNFFKKKEKKIVKDNIKIKGLKISDLGKNNVAEDDKMCLICFTAESNTIVEPC